ncbi:MAG: GNAT family N-acetyltransferase [Geminicoccaceae bacterium]
MAAARLAINDDLAALLALLPQANPSMPPLPDERARLIWHETMARDGVFVFVSEAARKIVASCMLITAPNLMRGGCGHGFIENVVTHRDFRRRGHGEAVIKAALQMAWANDCYHVLLQSGRKDPGVHRFYRSCGLKPGLRIGYVAHRPESE